MEFGMMFSQRKRIALSGAKVNVSAANVSTIQRIQMCHLVILHVVLILINDSYLISAF